MALGRDHCTIFLTLLAIYYYTNLTSLLTFSIIESFKFYSIKLLWMIQKERLLSISLRPLKLQVMWDQRDKFSVVLLPVLWKVISGGFSGSEKTYSSCVIFHNKILSEILINVSVPVTVVTALALCRAPGDPPRGRGRRVAALALAGMWPPARPADTEGRNHHHRGKSPGSWIWCGLEPMSFCIWISFSFLLPQITLSRQRFTGNACGISKWHKSAMTGPGGPVEHARMDCNWKPSRHRSGNPDSLPCGSAKLPNS